MTLLCARQKDVFSQHLILAANNKFTLHQNKPSIMPLFASFRRLLVLVGLLSIVLCSSAQSFSYQFWIGVEGKPLKPKAIKKGKLGTLRLFREASGPIQLVIATTGTNLDNTHTVKLLEKHVHEANSGLVGILEEANSSFVLNISTGTIQFHKGAEFRFFQLAKKEPATWLEYQAASSPSAVPKATSAPVFIGGSKAQSAFIVANQRYPNEAKDRGFSGMVVVKAKVNADGQVVGAKVERNADFPLDLEGLRLALLLPHLEPAKNNSGQPIVGWITLPVTFILM